MGTRERVKKITSEMTNLTILVFCGSVFAGKTRSMASICTTKTCKKCDAHVNAASGTQATLQKIDRVYQFCTRLLKLSNCCNSQNLWMGFSTDCNVCKGSSCTNQIVNVTNEMFTEQEFKDYKIICDRSECPEEIKNIFNEVEVCELKSKPQQKGFVTRNAPLLLILACGVLFVFILGTMAVFHHQRKQLNRLKEYRLTVTDDNVLKTDYPNVDSSDKTGV